MLRRSLLYLSNSEGLQRVLTGSGMTRTLSQRFVPGETVEELAVAICEANAEGLTATANYLGEAVRDRDTARAAADSYLKILDRIVEDQLDANISLKFTQMGQEIDEAFLGENLGRVLDRAERADIFVRFDMESSAYTTRTLDAFEALWEEGRRGIGVVLQSYLRRTAGDVRRMIDLGARVRLCKGAYKEPEKVAFQEMDEIRSNFVDLMKMLLREGNYPAIATHDELLIDETLEFARAEGIDADRFEFQLLYGVRRDLQQELLRDGFRVRVYIPFGEQWYPYLMRRLAERPENIGFFVGSMVKDSPLRFLWPHERRQ